MTKSKTNRNELAGVRETVESIGMAIIVAFVLRSFILEAFVIPTGSMAPELLGAHVQLTCPDCGYQFPFGLAFDPSISGMPRSGTGSAAHCPNCGERIDYNYRSNPARNGDRVLVQKFLYQFRPPRRYEVTVFKNPQSNRENYIKRLVGLPGEQLQIVNGDVFIRRLEDFSGDRRIDEADLETSAGRQTRWEIARKDLGTQESLWQLVFDNDYRPANRPERVEPFQPLWRPARDAEAWNLDGQDGRVFRYTGGAAEAVEFAQAPGQRRVFTWANSYNQRGESPLQDLFSDVVGDLKLSATLVPQADTRLSLVLTSLDHRFTGQIDVASGQVRLIHQPLDASGRPSGEARSWSAPLQVEVGEPVAVALTHADWRAALWVGGEPVLQTDNEYAPDFGALLDRMESRRMDGIPTPYVAFVAEGGELELRHVRVMRDVYYVSPNFTSDPPLNAFGEYVRRVGGRLLGQPGWGTTGRPIMLRAFLDDPDYDEFFMLGDNSPASLDSRLWLQASPTLRLAGPAGGQTYQPGTVPRYNLIGRAFFVYWPAGHPIPMGRRALPIIPNVGNMRRIR